MSAESTASNLFQGGVESLASGSWGPFIIAVAGEYINAWSIAATPGDSCTYVSNPDKLRKCSEFGVGDHDSRCQCFSKLTGVPYESWGGNFPGCYPPRSQALDSGQRLSMGSRGMSQKYTFSDPPNRPPCEEDGAPPNSCVYTFDAWNDVVDRAEVRRASRSDYSREMINEYWMGWKALDRKERLSRYQYNARVCLASATAQGLSDDQRIALEAHFGGRWSGQILRFNDEVIDGRPVGQYAAWIPLGPNEGELRRIYSRLQFENGLTLKDLIEISQMYMTEGLGLSFDLLPIEKQREAMAQAYVIEAVRAGADTSKYSESQRKLRAQEEMDLGWEPVGYSPRDASRQGFTVEGKPHTITEWDRELAADRLAKVARKLGGRGAPGAALQTVGQFAQTAGQAVRSVVSTPTRAAVSGLVVLGLAGTSYWVWKNHGKKIKAEFKKLKGRIRKPPLFKKLKGKIRKQLRRIAR